MKNRSQQPQKPKDGLTAFAVIYKVGHENLVMVDAKGNLPQVTYQIGVSPSHALNTSIGALSYRDTMPTIYEDTANPVFWCEAERPLSGYHFVDRNDSDDMAKVSFEAKSIINNHFNALLARRKRGNSATSITKLKRVAA